MVWLQPQNSILEGSCPLVFKYPLSFFKVMILLATNYSVEGNHCFILSKYQEM